MLFLSFEYLKFLFSCFFHGKNKNRSDYEIKFLKAITLSKMPSENFQIPEQARKSYSRNNSELEIVDFGAGSKIFSTNKRMVSDMVKHVSLGTKYGRLLSSLCTSFQVNNALELGTSLGLTSLYLAYSSSKIKIYTVEACPNTAELAKKTFQQMNTNNITLHLERFDSFFESNKINPLTNFVFIDGNHSYEASLNYFNILVKTIDQESILVFDDIRHSKEMLRAWKYITNSPDSYLCIDLFRLGIVFLSNKSPKKIISICH